MIMSAAGQCLAHHDIHKPEAQLVHKPPRSAVVDDGVVLGSPCCCELPESGR